MKDCEKECKYCESSELKDMFDRKKNMSSGDISAYVSREEGLIRIETSVDNLYANIDINYCPKCGDCLI